MGKVANHAFKDITRRAPVITIVASVLAPLSIVVLHLLDHVRKGRACTKLMSVQTWSHTYAKLVKKANTICNQTRPKNAAHAVLAILHAEGKMLGPVLRATAQTMLVKRAQNANQIISK